MIRPRFVVHTLATVFTITTLARAETFELTTATIAEINAAFDAGALTSERLVELCLARIEAYEQTPDDVEEARRWERVADWPDD